jgi:Anthrone oxygenase
VRTFGAYVRCVCIRRFSRWVALIEAQGRNDDATVGLLGVLSGLLGLPRKTCSPASRPRSAAPKGGCKGDLEDLVLAVARDLEVDSSAALECEDERMERKASAASALTTGVLAGAMILIRLVLVPSWRRGATSEFKPWFIENSPRLRNVMVPLGTVAAATTTANALITHRGRADLAAAAAVGVGLVTMTVNEPLNARFAGPDPIDPADLDRWVRWHDVRVVLGLIAAWASVDPVRRGTKRKKGSR